MITEKCNICPRKCNTLRDEQKGICGLGNKIRVARIGLHKWEEPCISYGNGSGTVFFSGCSLKCVFCQNKEISRGLKGKDISANTLAEEFLHLEEIGASNINLVTPTHFTPFIIDAIRKVKHKINIPIIYNCGGYEDVDTLLALEGYIDIFMPDFKYCSEEYSLKYSKARDYFQVASKAIHTMHKLVGYADIDEAGHMKKGVLVRHLVLPNLYKDSIKIFEYLAKEYDVNKIAISVMSQYTPTEDCKNYPEINRRITSLEYEKVVRAITDLGFSKGYFQEKISATADFLPDFDY